MSSTPCVSPQSPTDTVVFEACTAGGIAGSQEEKVLNALNAEAEMEEPTEVREGAEAAAAGDTSEELGGGDIDEGVENDSETFRCVPCDADGAEYKVSPDPGEPTASQVEDHRACGHWPYRSWCSECVRG